MNVSSKKIISFGAGLAWALMAVSSAQSQDVELFVGNAASNALARPNILLVLDDSISMNGSVTTQLSFDPSTIYPISVTASCDVSRVYWSTSGTPPDCATTDNWFNLSALKCKRALDAFSAKFGGLYTDNMAQYDTGPQTRWEQISTTEKSNAVECQDDRPDSFTGWPGHGDGTDASRVYAQNKDTSALWSNSFSDEISWGRNPVDETYTVYSGNYMNWFYGAPVLTTRLDVMKDVANSLVSSINGVNIGLMSFNYQSGGIVRQAMGDVTNSRTSMQNAVSALTPSNWTPLEETLYEAYLYMRGLPILNGGSSVAAAKDPTNSSRYKTPINLECQKNHIVILTDGEPTSDVQVHTNITGLVDASNQSFGTLVGASCDAEATGSNDGKCLDDLAEFMNKGDMSALPGEQHITIHTVGFLADFPLLKDTAARGGGQYRTATNTATLSTALTNIITNILDTQATFTAPSVSINSFNQTRNLDELYISVFSPSGTTHWPGNLKKYRLRASDATIVDKNDNPAIDPATGFFSAASESFWSVGDGDDIEAGGAANMIPDPRTVFTYFGNSDLNDVSNKVAKTNAAFDDTLLNTGGVNRPTRDEVIDFMNGLDASDIDKDTILTESRNQMGDPLHAQPVSVVYGPTTDDARIYFATNDGYLHAIDTLTGVEQWAFIPPEFLDNQVDFFIDNASNVGVKRYGIDGNLRVQTIADNDGVIEPANGERVYLYFGMRRGGDFYYALDVTDPDDPQLMWRLDSVDLPNLGLSWGSVTPAKINIQGATQNAEKMVLVISGGYDPSQDFNFTSTDSSGNALYIVDSVSGDLLWYGGKSGGDKDFDTAGKAMDYSIPGDIRVVDLNGDQFADRMYAADMGGQVWRFDITNGQPASTLVNGGVIAQLGAAGLAAPTLQETRRFYYAPDVALVSTGDYSYIHVGIGSGYRAHPNDTINQNRFYALRDYDTFNKLTQAQYDAITPVVDADLVDVTADASASVPQGAPGWKLLLDDGGWIGEKVLAETRTFNNTVYVTTFRPGTAGVGCEPSLGTNRQYVMSLFNGAPVNNLDTTVDSDPDNLTVEDRYTEYEGAPPPETVFIFADDPACVGGQCPPIACVDVNCGLTNFPNNPVRTFWSQENIE